MSNTPAKTSTKKRSTVPFAHDQAQSEAIFNSMGDGAIATDEFGRITRINPPALKILGYKEHELLGKWFPKAIVALSADNNPVSLIDRPVSRAFLTGRSISEKMIYRRKDGQAIPVAVTVSPIMLGDKPLGAIEVFRDVTLEHEVDRMKSEFISLASHQLRTPLSAVKTYSHMLLEGYMGDLNGAQKKSLRTIIAASNRMNELISTLLNITRMESGTIALVPKTISVNKLAEEVVKELQHTATEKEISLNLSIPKRAISIRTDNLIAKEILTNLITNAIKYTPENGTVDVTIKLRAHDVVFSVKDSGLGIPKFAQDQIFTKFFRAQNVIKRETSGTGLGLYLVKGLVDVLGGKVWFESAEDVGSTFYFCLPRPKTTASKSTS